MTGPSYIRITRSGRPEFVRSNSYSHHHHRHHHACRCFDDCAGVSRAEYDNILDQNRNFREVNGTLLNEKESLKNEVRRLLRTNQAVFAENQRLAGDNEVLREEVLSLRRSVSVEDDHNGRFKRRIKDFERDIKQKEKDIRDLTKHSNAVIHGLERQVTEAHDIGGQWKRKFEEMKNNYDSVRRSLAVRDAQLESRDAVIHDRNSTIRRLQDLMARYRGW
ncbi:hypothetical protein BJ170DRAFT_310223 [Xylariales sp. AK1849]|nr:hypothetical protein BJ170DRAFT_310223 [Xylariales sp. AK1849]